MAQTQTHFDLLDAFNETGCPICRLGLAAVDRWMDAVNYESVGDPGLRARLRAAKGFCNRHAHQWLGRAHLLGTAQIYQDILVEVTSELRSLRPSRDPAVAGLASLFGPAAVRNGTKGLEPAGGCPACQVLAERESMLAGRPPIDYRCRTQASLPLDGTNRRNDHGSRRHRMGQGRACLDFGAGCAV